jgi:hypothetical protein
MILFVLVEIGNESVWLISRITGPQRTVLTFLQLASCSFFPSYVTCRPSLSHRHPSSLSSFPHITLSLSISLPFPRHNPESIHVTYQV